MKRVGALLLVFMFLGFARAETVFESITSELIQYDLRILRIASGLIDWEVGEWTSYKLKTTFGAGDMKKEVTSDEGTALWLTSYVTLLGQKQKIEALIRKADGKTLKLLIDGKEQDVPDVQYDILEQKEDNIKVPKFPNGIDCIYLKLKEKEKGTIIKTWINPRDVFLDGMVKTETSQGFMTISIELENFGKGA